MSKEVRWEEFRKSCGCPNPDEVSFKNGYDKGMFDVKDVAAELENENSRLKSLRDEVKVKYSAAVAKAIACLDAVDAMLAHSAGTHRMRDFYNDAMQAYISRVRSSLASDKEAIEKASEDDVIPF